MATQQFNKLTTAFLDRENKGFQIEMILNAGDTSDWYQIPAGASLVGCLVTPNGAGSGKVQITNDTLIRCDAGTAVSEDWPAGVVAATTSDAVYNSITAVRGVFTAGSIRVIFTAQ